MTTLDWPAPRRARFLATPEGAVVDLTAAAPTPGATGRIRRIHAHAPRIPAPGDVMDLHPASTPSHPADTPRAGDRDDGTHNDPQPADVLSPAHGGNAKQQPGLQEPAPKDAPAQRIVEDTAPRRPRVALRRPDGIPLRHSAHDWWRDMGARQRSLLHITSAALTGAYGYGLFTGDWDRGLPQTAMAWMGAADTPDAARTTPFLLSFLLLLAAIAAGGALYAVPAHYLTLSPRACAVLHWLLIRVPVTSVLIALALYQSPHPGHLMPLTTHIAAQDLTSAVGPLPATGLALVLVAVLVWGVIGKGRRALRAGAATLVGIETELAFLRASSPFSDVGEAFGAIPRAIADAEGLGAPGMTAVCLLLVTLSAFARIVPATGAFLGLLMGAAFQDADGSIWEAVVQILLIPINLLEG